MFIEKVPPLIEIAALVLYPLAVKVPQGSKLSAPLVLCPPPPRWKKCMPQRSNLSALFSIVPPTRWKMPLWLKLSTPLYFCAPNR